MRVNIARTTSAWLILPHSPSARSPPEATDDGGEDDQRDVAVDVEEGDVETREVSGADERVLVDQERHDRRPAEPVEEPEPGEPTEERERRRGERVVDARGGEGGGDAETRGDGVEPLRAVHLDVLTGVDQVEAGDPHSEREPEDDRRRVERPADRDPAAGRRDPVGEAEDPVRRPREALGVRVADK